MRVSPGHFEGVIPTDRFLSSEGDLSFYGKDSCKDFQGVPSIVCLPRSVDEVSKVIAFCSKEGISVVPSGGRTGYSGGATASKGELLLSLEKLNKIIEISPESQTMTVEAGVTTEKIRVAAEGVGLFYGVDFSSKGSSHIGGNIATNAGGIRVIRYGNTRDWILGLKVVLANGEVLSLNGALIKNQTGYDLRHLFIGSEGTLGIIVEATIKLAAPPRRSALALCGFDSLEKVTSVLATLKKAGRVINVFEYFDSDCLDLVTSKTGLGSPLKELYPAYALIEVESIDEAELGDFEGILVKEIEDGVISDVTVAQSDTQAAGLMAFRERISECIGKHHVPHKNDVSVPIKFISPFVRDFSAVLKRMLPEAKALIFGHIGDGNLHINILKPEGIDAAPFFKKCNSVDEETFKVVKKYEGSISAEHGVGLLKKPFLSYSRSATEIELMRSLKKVFDPNCILNPGKIFD